MGYESCLSVADSGLYTEVERSKSVELEWSSDDGETHSGTFDEFFARIIQHEYDHIEGVVILDKMHSTKTVMSASEFLEKNTDVAS